MVLQRADGEETEEGEVKTSACCDSDDEGFEQGRSGRHLI